MVLITVERGCRIGACRSIRPVPSPSSKELRCADRRRERRAAGRLDRDVGDGARVAARRRSRTTGAESSEIDAAGNQWFTLRGALRAGAPDRRPHGLRPERRLARRLPERARRGVETLRRIADEGTPPVTVRLVDWADEEGARFGRSLFGSSAAGGSMADQDELRKLRRPRTASRCRTRSARTVSTSTVRSRRAASSRARPPTSSCTSSRGRCSSRSDLPLGVVLGTFGVERRRITWRGQAAHAGSTPMDSAATRSRAPRSSRSRSGPIARRGRRRRGLHVGGVVCKPGIVTSVVETAEQLLDQRHLDAAKLARMLERAKELVRALRGEEDVEVDWERLWNDPADPVRRDADRARRRGDPRGRRRLAPAARPGRCTTRPRWPGRACRP